MREILIPIFGMLIPIIIVPTALGIKHARYLRETEHKERMRAMELGRRLSQDGLGWTPVAYLSGAIGAVVPVCALVFAWLASQAVGFHEEIWIMSGMVGIAAVISGSWLVHKNADRLTLDEPVKAAGAKPYVDADAFDVVGTRG